MIPAREVIYAFRQYYDRYDGKRSPTMDIRAQSFIIDQAIKKFIDSTLALAEIDSTRRENIRVLEKKGIFLQESGSTHNAVIYGLPEDHLQTLNRSARISNQCGSRDVPLVLMQADDTNFAINNMYWKPSLEWEQAFCDEGEKGLYVFNGDFNVDSVIIDYYRKHVTFDCPSLADGGRYLRGGDTTMITTDTGLELPERTLDRIIQIAAMLSEANNGDDRDLSVRIRAIMSVS